MNVSDDITAKLRVSRCRAVLEAKLFADAGTKQGYRRQIEPDWASIHRQLKRKHVTLSILWDEYVEACPPRFGTARRSASSGALGYDAPDPRGWPQTRRTSPYVEATAGEEYPQQRSFQVALRAAPKTQAGRPGWS
jgi:hypothetical protein